MIMRFRQRFFSWFDSYDIYDEAGNTLYTVRGQFAWGHCLKIYDAAGREVGTVQERVLTWLPKFELYCGSQYMGCIRREWSPFRPRYVVECNGWNVQGNWMEWDYTICDAGGHPAAIISKELFHWTDTYSIHVMRPEDALCALMVVLAIDAEKCSRGD